MTNDVQNLRQKRGLKRYYEMPVIMTGSVTGFELKFMSLCRRQERTTYIRTGNAFADAEAEVRLTEEIDSSDEREVSLDVGGGAPAGTEMWKVVKRKRTAGRPQISEEEDRSEESDEDGKVAMMGFANEEMKKEKLMQSMRRTRWTMDVHHSY